MTSKNSLILVWCRLQVSDAFFYERPKAGVQARRLGEIVLCFACVAFAKHGWNSIPRGKFVT